MNEEIVVGQPLDLVVLACKSNALRCRLLGSDREITLRTAVRDEFPGAIITVMPAKQWTHARHPYLSGDIVGIRSDVVALGLQPLSLHERGEWDPAREYWAEDGAPIEEWAKTIISHGRRPMFEMEQVLPGVDPENFDSDPIVEAGELHEAGDSHGAYQILMKLLGKDLRCLAAHAHLGRIEFDRNPKLAMRHYETGTAIGALSLGLEFDGVLAWGLTDNRPFLRCLNGTGLCAWRLDDRPGATAVFEKMRWLNPADNQGARSRLADLADGRPWT